MHVLSRLKRVIFPKLNQHVRTFPLPRFEMQDSIPKIIHQVFFVQGKPLEPLPDSAVENIARIKAMNPHWEHRFYDEAAVVRFVEKEYGPIAMKYFEQITPEYAVARIDLFKYLLMYKCGGLYLDIKSTTIRPLDDFLQRGDRFFLTQWQNCADEAFEGWGMDDDLAHIDGGEYQQWYMLTVPGHPFLRAVCMHVLSNISRYVPELHGIGKRAVLRVSGPIAYTLAIEPLLSRYPHSFMGAHSAIPLKYSVYDTDLHFKLFKTHYSQVKSALITPGIVRRMLSGAIPTLNRLESLLLKKPHKR